MKGEGVIFYNEPPTLVHSGLVRQIHWRFRVLQHGLIKKKTRPGTLFYGNRGEYCCCKYRVFLYPHNFSNFVLPGNPAYIQRKCFALSLYEIW